MKEFLLNLWEKIKKSTVKVKILLSLLIVLYIGIVTISLVQLEVDATTPGSITNVSNVINIESENKTGNIYTVSVFSKSKVSVMQYLLMKLDKNTDIELGQSITYSVLTQNEDYQTNVGFKYQSIQDSIIVAYTKAKEEGFNVSLDYSYKGQNLINIPQNLYKTGSEDFKNNDIVTGYNDVMFTSNKDYINTLDEIFSGIEINGSSIKELKYEGKFNFFDENGNKIEDNIKLVFNIYELVSKEENTYSFNIFREKEDKKVTASLKMLFYLYSGYILKDDKLYSSKVNNFDYYTINYDKCSPKIDISKTTTVGPSGGLLQTLAVYNAITTDDVTKGKKIMGTGGISLDGTVSSIGGEKQKVITANLYTADIFFIPEENYQTAKQQYDLMKEVSYELVSVKTFNDVLNYLKNMEVKNG